MQSTLAATLHCLLEKWHVLQLLVGDEQVDAVILSVLHEVSQMPRVYVAAQRLTNRGMA